MKSYSFIIMFTLFVACNDKDCRTIDNQKPKGPDYTMDIPLNWDIKRNIMGCDKFALTPLDDTSDNFRENINVVIENLPPEINLDAFYEANKHSMKQMQKSFRLISVEHLAINNEKFIKMTYKMNMGSQTMKNNVFFTIKNGSGYSITASMLEGSYNQYHESLDQIIRTFQFKK